MLIFGADANHRNHIHISFGPNRAGTYLTPVQAASLIEGTTPETTSATVGSIDKFKKSYKKDAETRFKKEEVMTLLASSGIFSDEAAAVFVGISERESGGWKPGTLNPNKSTGDFSFGLFQINLRPEAHGTKKFTLLYPKKDNVLGLKLAYSVDTDMDPESLARKLETSANRSTTDSRLYIPYNQVLMLAAVAVGPERAAAKIAKKEEIDSYCYGAWGDYKVSKGQSVIGCLALVRYSVVRDVYISYSKKSEETLKRWIIQRFNGSPGYKYLDKWFSGQIIKNSGEEEKDKDF